MPGQRFGDFDKLAFALRKSHDLGSGRDMQVDQLKRLLRLLSENPSVDERKPARPSRKMIEEDVLLDTEIRKETQLLVNERDAESDRVARIRRRNFFSSELDTAAVAG